MAAHVVGDVPENLVLLIRVDVPDDEFRRDSMPGGIRGNIEDVGPQTELR
jgi:hypothetical protein